jgi:hypothetical protein
LQLKLVKPSYKMISKKVEKLISKYSCNDALHMHSPNDSNCLKNRIQALSVSIYCCTEHKNNPNLDFPFLSLGICSSFTFFLKNVIQSGMDSGIIQIQPKYFESLQSVHNLSWDFRPSSSIKKNIYYRKIYSLLYSLDWLEQNSSSTSEITHFQKPNPSFLSFIFNYFKKFKLRVLKKLRLVSVRTRWKLIQLDSLHGISIREITDSTFNYADPFIWFDNANNPWIICESWSKESNKANISISKLPTQAEEASFSVIIDEPFHLSFPFVFEYHGSTFILPQSATGSELRFYKNETNQLHWNYSFSINLPIPLVDVICICVEEVWWLIGSAKDPIRNIKNRLFAFYASELNGKTLVKSHRNNPILWSDFGGRNGGVFEIADKIYRVGQFEGSDIYGFDFKEYEILELTLDIFQQMPLVGSFTKHSHHKTYVNGLCLIDFQWTEMYFPITDFFVSFVETIGKKLRHMLRVLR